MTLVPSRTPRAWLRGIPGVLTWHGVGFVLLFALVASLIVKLNAAEEVEHAPDAWAALGIFFLALLGTGLLVASCVVAVLVMALVAPRVAWADLSRHAFAVSFGSLLLTAVTSLTLLTVSSLVG